MTSLEEQEMVSPSKSLVPPGSYDAGFGIQLRRPTRSKYWERHFGERAMLAGMQTTKYMRNYLVQDRGC
jgi:hypothetical protein